MASVQGPVALLDWNCERLAKMVQGLIRSGIEARQCTDIHEAANLHASVLLIPASWPSDKPKITVLGDDKATAVLRGIRRLAPRSSTIVFAGTERRIDITDRCRYVLEGARYVVDSSNRGELESDIRECLQNSGLPEDGPEPQEAPETGPVGIVYASSQMREVLRQVKKVATVKHATVLLTGPTGSGKQRLAEAIHQLDPWRRNAPLITVNCSTISAALAESELFGHRRGSYTGATGDRMGYFRAANHGTLFLDEIGELDLALQPKLLRALEEKKVRALGQDTECEVDVRVIAATNRDLRAMVAEGRFRMDFYQRLSVVEIAIPPLSRRPEDILPLIKFFLAKYRDLYKGQANQVDPSVIDVLARYGFEGNVRELENIVRHVLFNKERGDTIKVEDLPKRILASVVGGDRVPNSETVSEYLSSRVVRDGMSLNDVLKECECSLLNSVLDHTQGKRTTAAKLLGISERTLYNKLSDHFPQTSESEPPLENQIKACPDHFAGSQLHTRGSAPLPAYSTDGGGGISVVAS
jgi:transcriptional regulator with PAS, ATPase and Fis domain